MAPLLSGNYRQDGIFPPKTRLYGELKNIVQTPGVCWRLYPSLQYQKLEIQTLKVNFWALKMYFRH